MTTAVLVHGGPRACLPEVDDGEQVVLYPGGRGFDGVVVTARPAGRPMPPCRGKTTPFLRQQADIMKQAQHRLTLDCRGQGLHEITGGIADWLSGQAVREGLLTVFIRHTSASLVIQENADPDVQRDIESFLAKLVPEDPRLYRHNAEGPDDMPAHIKGVLTQTQLSIPVSGGRMLLGTWQGVYLFEHRRTPHRRELVLHLIGQ